MTSFSPDNSGFFNLSDRKLRYRKAEDIIKEKFKTQKLLSQKPLSFLAQLILNMPTVFTVAN